MERFLYVAILSPFLLGVAGLAWWLYRQVPPSRAFVRDRPESTQEWSSCYEPATLKLASELLDAVCEAFIFEPTDKWRLLPCDRISEIYFAQYPSKLGLPDSLEHVFLFNAMRERFDVPEAVLFELWRRDPTIDDLVQACLDQAKASRTVRHR